MYILYTFLTSKKMFIEEILCMILKHITNSEELCALRYVNSQFNRITREILHNSHIFIEGISKKPLSKRTPFKKETRILHHFLNTSQSVKCNVVLFEIGAKKTFACPCLPSLFSDDNSSEMDLEDCAEAILCLCPSAHLISFERLTLDNENVFTMSPQYIKIEKIHHIQAFEGVEIAVKMGMDVYNNLRVPIRVRIIELTELKDKKYLAPFLEDIIPLTSPCQLAEFKNCLQESAVSSYHHTDATRIKFDEFYDHDYELIRKFVDIVNLSKKMNT